MIGTRWYDTVAVTDYLIWIAPGVNELLVETSAVYTNMALKERWLKVLKI
jgi:hypothetical protein